MATLGENLKSIRKAKKMTQKELSQKSGVKQSVISDLETGNAKSTGSILKLFENLVASISVFFSDSVFKSVSVLDFFTEAHDHIPNASKMVKIIFFIFTNAL